MSVDGPFWGMVGEGFTELVGLERVAEVDGDLFVLVIHLIHSI
jgi:hypothetical protein